MFKKIVLILLCTISSLSIAGDLDVHKDRYRFQKIRGQNASFHEPRGPIEQTAFFRANNNRSLEKALIEPTIVNRFIGPMGYGAYYGLGAFALGTVSFMCSPFDKSYFKTYCRDVALPIATKCALMFTVGSFLRDLKKTTDKEYITKAEIVVNDLIDEINNKSDVKKAAQKLSLINTTLDHIASRNNKESKRLEKMWIKSGITGLRKELEGFVDDFDGNTKTSLRKGLKVLKESKSISSK